MDLITLALAKKSAAEMVQELEQSILNAPLKNIKWEAYSIVEHFFDGLETSPKYFNVFLIYNIDLAYKCRHYSCDLTFNYVPNTSSGTFDLVDPITATVVHTFQLIEGTNHLHLEWHDEGTDAMGDDGAPFTLRISVNNSAVQTLSSNFCIPPASMASVIIVPDINDDEESWPISNASLTNLILY